MNKVRSLKTTLPILTAFLLITTAASVAFAQRSPNSVQRRVDELNRQGEEFEREQLKADLKGRRGKPADRKRARALASEVEQDLNNLQAGYNHIVLAMAKAQFAYGSISEAMTEIAKSSTRLKDNLALPQLTDQPEKSPQQETDSERLEDLLLSLRKHIYNFITNPLFESQGVLNVDQAKAASSDLDKIIALSKIVRRNGDRLKEGPKPTANQTKP